MNNQEWNKEVKLAEVEERIFGGDCKGWLHAQVVL